MTTKLVVCILFCGLFTIQTVGHMNSDPAPGRSPGPPLRLSIQYDHDNNNNNNNSNINKYNQSNQNENNNNSKNNDDEKHNAHHHMTRVSNVAPINDYKASEQQQQNNISISNSFNENNNNNNNKNNNKLNRTTAYAGSAINLILGSPNHAINSSSSRGVNDAETEAKNFNDRKNSFGADGTTTKTTAYELQGHKFNRPTESPSKNGKSARNIRTSSPACDDHLSDFLNDVVVVDESEPTDSENDTQHPLLEHGFNIQLKLEHDLFDTTALGINCGQMYKVRLITNLPSVSSSVAQSIEQEHSTSSPSPSTPLPTTSAHYSGEFLVESFSSANSRERGSFVGHSMGNKLPISWFSTLHHRSGKDGSTDVPLQLFPTHGKQNVLKNDAMKNEFNSVIASDDDDSDYDHNVESESFQAQQQQQHKHTSKQGGAAAGDDDDGDGDGTKHADTEHANRGNDELPCYGNVWRDIAKSHPMGASNGESTESVNFWLLNELCNQDDTIEFRVFFRASIRWINLENVTNDSAAARNQSTNNDANAEAENLLHKKTFKFKLRKDCQMLLREITTSTLDYTMLPLYAQECTVYFPSFQQQQQQQQQQEQHPMKTIGHAAPGILVELQRLNVPCSSGAYVRFSNRSMVCGKLEELRDAQRIYHFDVRSRASVQFYKNPMFSLSFKLVDSCYNVSSSNQSAEFFIQPTRYDSLECYFRIHLPFGNRISLQLVTNNASSILPTNINPAQNEPYPNGIGIGIGGDGAGGGIPFGETLEAYSVFTSNGETVTMEIVNLTQSASAMQRRTQMIWVNDFVGNSTTIGGIPPKQTSRSKTQIPIANCAGVVIKVFENEFSKWSHCVKNAENMRAFILESTGNTLSVHLFRAAQQQPQQLHHLQHQQHTSSASNRLNIVSNGGSASGSGVVARLPTVYLSYAARPVRDIVSNCAFGWIAIQQFCVTLIERPLRWHEAEQHCVTFGGHLASIRNDVQQEVINQLLQHSPSYQDENAYWIGGSDKSYEGDFRWSDGLLFQYTNWFPGWLKHGYYNKQPNDDGLSNQDCIEMRRYFRTPPGIQAKGNSLTNGFMWNDRDCNAKNFFLCERAMSDETLRRSWINDCNKTVSLSKEHSRASVWSPSFPRQYPDNANCFTTITAPAGYRIVIEFEELVIENEPGCTYDYLEITEPTHTDYVRYSKASKHKLTKNNFNNSNNNSNNNASTNKTFRKRSSYENPSLSSYTSNAPATTTNTINSNFNSNFNSNSNSNINVNSNIYAVKDNNFNSNINGDNYLYSNNYNNNYNLAQSNYGKFLHILSNLYKPHTNFIVQTPDYPKGNPHNHHHMNSVSENEQLPKRLCGDWSSKLKLLRHVTSSSYLGLHFVSDYSHHFGGFKAKVYMQNRSHSFRAASECANERLKYYNGSCYLFVSYPEVDWWTAQQICHAMNAKLASVSTSDEHRFITSNIRNQIDYSPQLIYWLGAELEKSGQFEWTDDTKMSFQGWLPGQGQFDVLPSDATCLGLQWKMSPTPMLPSGLYWQSQKCNKIGGYVCKKPKDSLGKNSFSNFTVTGSEGRLVSPAYPSQYPLNLDYWVHVKSPERTRIVIQFQKIDLESQDECLYDFVSIEDYDLVSRITLEPGANPLPMAMLMSEDDLKASSAAISDGGGGGVGVRDGDDDDGMQTLISNNKNRLLHSRQRRRNKRSNNMIKINNILTSSTAKSRTHHRQQNTIDSNKFHQLIQAAIQITRRAQIEAQKQAKLMDSTERITTKNRKILQRSSSSTSSSLSSASSSPSLSSKNNGQREIKAKDNKPSESMSMYLRDYNDSDNDKTKRNENPKHRRRKKLDDLKKEIENKLQKSRVDSDDIKENSLQEMQKKHHRYDGDIKTRQRKRRSAANILKDRDMSGTRGVGVGGRRTLHYNFVDNAQSFLPYVRWCGSHDSNMSKFDFVSNSNQVLINFHSDYSITGLGFAAVWKAVDVTGCPMQTLTSRQGTVISPNYPHFLLHNLNCAFVIQAPIGRRVWLELTDYNLIEDSLLEVDIGNGPFRPFNHENHANDGIFVSKREQLRIQIRTGQRPRGKGFQAIYHTVGQLERRERVISLTSNETNYLYQLNFPDDMPANVDFTQHLVAPFGDNILLELYGVEFSENGCPDNNLLEVYDNYADDNGTKWRLCKFESSQKSYEHASSLDSSATTTTTATTTTSWNTAVYGYLHEPFVHYDRVPSAILFNSRHHEEVAPPVYITSYLNTLHIRQRTANKSIANLNATIRLQWDNNFKLKLAMSDKTVESCHPNPCQYNGKCITNNGSNYCQCQGHHTGRFCGLTMCDVEPCVFGRCELTPSSFKCQCQPGYMGTTCEQKLRPCADNPCEGRGICYEKNGGFFCRCHAWWEGHRCERRMLHIPYKPLSERMLQEPFWLGLITVFVVLAVIGLVWCAKRHFPEKIEKLLAEEADRNRPPGSIHGHHHHTSLREQLQFTTAIPQTTVSNAPGAQRSIFNRLGIRKPSLLSLSSPNPTPGGGGAAARTFSLDDLLRPPPRRSPSPRKKRNNSTPVKKNAAEKTQILQQLVSPAATQAKPKPVSLGELISMTENRLRVNNIDSESGDLKETTFSENSGSLTSATVARTIADPKLEKKVTFARLLNKVSAEMSSGSEMDIGHMGGTRNSSALSLPTDIHYRACSMPPSPCTNDIRSPHSTSSNQGSDSLSSSDLALNDFGLRSMQTSSVEIHAGPNKHIVGLSSGRGRSACGTRPKVTSADSILAMFRNFAVSNSNSHANSIPTSVFVSPSTTPTVSSPQDDAPGDDESSTSSMHTPVSYSSGAPDSPIFYRQTTIEVPVLDVINAHKSTSPSSSTSSSSTNLLHPPSILLEIPSNGINKCLSPIREMPTPIPSPALTPIMPRPQRSNSPIFQEDPLSGGDYTEDDDDITDRSEHSDAQLSEQIILGLKKDKTLRLMDSDVETTPTDTTTTSTAEIGGKQRQMHRLPIIELSTPTGSSQKPIYKLTPPLITIDIEPPTPEEKATRPRDLIIPTLTVEQPSPTRNRHPLIIFPGSPPPQRASIGETSFMFPNKQQQKRLLKQYEKPTSLDFPFAPPTITVTSNMSEMESDTEPLSPAPNKSNAPVGLMPPNPVGMCYLSPFTMCSRSDRTISESNLSSSGYSSMASPGPSRCGSSNPLCPNEMDEPGSGHSGAGLSLHVSLLNRRKNSNLASCKENVTNGEGGTSGTSSSSNNQQLQSHRLRSDSETFSDDILVESNDEGIGTDHIDDKLDESRGRFKELDVFMEDQVLIEVEEPPPPPPTISISNISSNQMAQLQLPSIVIQMDGSDKGLSPVSSRSESPLSERAGIGRFSPHFYGRKDQLPFTDSDGLYDFPSSDGKGTSAQSYTHQRRSSSKKRDRKSSKCSPISTQSPTKQQLDMVSKDLLLNTPTTSSSSHHHHVCNKHCHSHHHPCPAAAGSARKSPKRRMMNRLPIASSSSSSESLTSTKELTVRPLPRRLNSPNREKRIRKQESLSEDEVADILLRRISPSVVKEDIPTKPKSKIHRLRAIGNQIRFLRRLEKSIKTRERLASPTDSCPEENTDDMDSPQATSPLLQQPTSPNKSRIALCRQKRIAGNTYGITASALHSSNWKGMDRSLIADDLNSD